MYVRANISVRVLMPAYTDTNAV